MNLGAGQPATLPQGVIPQWWYSYHSMQSSSPLQQSPFSSVCYHQPPPGNYPPPNHYPPPHHFPQQNPYPPSGNYPQPNYYPSPHHFPQQNPYPPPLHFAELNSYPPPPTANPYSVYAYQPHFIPTNQFIPPPHTTHEPIANPQPCPVSLQLDRVTDSEIPIVDSSHSSFQISDARLDEFIESVSRLFDNCIAKCGKGIRLSEGLSPSVPTQTAKLKSSEPRVCSPLRLQPVTKSSSLLGDAHSATGGVKKRRHQKRNKSLLKGLVVSSRLGNTVSIQMNTDSVSGTGSIVPNLTSFTVPNPNFVNNSCDNIAYVTGAKSSGVDMICDNEKRSSGVKVEMDNRDGKELGELEGISVKQGEMQGPYSCDNALSLLDKISKSDRLGFAGETTASVMSIRDKGGGLVHQPLEYAIGSVKQDAHETRLCMKRSEKPAQVFVDKLENKSSHVKDGDAIKSVSDVVISGSKCEDNESACMIDKVDVVINSKGVSMGIWEFEVQSTERMNNVIWKNKFQSHSFLHTNFDDESSVELTPSVHYGIPSLPVMTLNGVTHYKLELLLKKWKARATAETQSQSNLVQWLILCLRLCQYKMKENLLSCREAFDGMGEMTQTSVSQCLTVVEDKLNQSGTSCIGDHELLILVLSSGVNGDQQLPFVLPYVMAIVMGESFTSMVFLQHEYQLDPLQVKAVITIIQLYLDKDAHICKGSNMITKSGFKFEKMLETGTYSSLSFADCISLTCVLQRQHAMEFLVGYLTSFIKFTSFGVKEVQDSHQIIVSDQCIEALRSTTNDEVCDSGAGLLFNILQLLLPPTLEAQKRPLLVKLIDKLLHEVAELCSSVHKILVEIKTGRITEDYPDLGKTSVVITYYIFFRNLNAEVIGGVIMNEENASDYLTWSLICWNFTNNHIHYDLQGVLQSRFSNYSLELVEHRVSNLVTCDLLPLNLDMIALYHSLREGKTCYLLLGDIFRASEDKVFCYGDGKLIQLLKNLSSKQCHQYNKHQTVTWLCDMALIMVLYYWNERMDTTSGWFLLLDMREFSLIMLTTKDKADIYLNHGWEVDFHDSAIVRFDNLKAVLRSNLDVNRWMGLLITCLQGPILLLAVILEVFGFKDDAGRLWKSCMQLDTTDEYRFVVCKCLYGLQNASTQLLICWYDYFEIMIDNGIISAAFLCICWISCDLFSRQLHNYHKAPGESAGVIELESYHGYHVFLCIAALKIYCCCCCACNAFIMKLEGKFPLKGDGMLQVKSLQDETQRLVVI